MQVTTGVAPRSHALATVEPDEQMFPSGSIGGRRTSIDATRSAMRSHEAAGGDVDAASIKSAVCRYDRLIRDSGIGGSVM